MGISKPSQAWAKHQKDMAVLTFLSKDLAVLYSVLRQIWSAAESLSGGSALLVFLWFALFSL